MTNRKRKMSYYTLWIKREEEIELIKSLSKDLKSKDDLALIGDIFCRINSRGDFKNG